MKLEYLYSIVELHSEKAVGKAAAKLEICDKTLKKYIANIEEEIGKTIIENDGKKVNFTKEGEELYLYAHNIITTLNGCKNSVPIKKEVYVIASEIKIFFASVLLASRKVIEKFNVKFDFKQLYREEILKGIMDGTFDVGIVIMDEGLRVGLDEYGLEFKRVADRKTVVIVGEKHPLANKEEISLTELREYKRIAFENPFDDYYSYYYNIENKYDLRKDNINLKYLGEIIFLLRQSSHYFICGITSEEAVLLNGVKVIPISQIKEGTEVGYIYKKGTEFDEVIKTLVKVINDNIEKRCNQVE